MAQQKLPPNPDDGERALRDMRSLWPVPTFVLTVIIALLSVFGRGSHVSWLWGALAVFVFIFFLYNRRALALAGVLHQRAVEAAAARDQLAALNALGQALAAHLDLTPTLETVCAQTAAALHAPRVALVMREQPEDPATTRAALGFDALPTPDALAALPHVLHAPLTGPGGRAAGTLFVQGLDAPTDTRTQAMLAAFAAQASLAITNARLYEQSLRHAGNLRSLARRVAEAVAASDDLRRVAAPVAEQAVSLLACASAQVYLLSEDRQTLTPMASFPAGQGGRGTFQAGRCWTRSGRRQRRWPSRTRACWGRRGRGPGAAA